MKFYNLEACSHIFAVMTHLQENFKICYTSLLASIIDPDFYENLNEKEIVGSSSKFAPHIHIVNVLNI